MTSEFDKLCRVAASPEVFAAALALSGRFRQLLMRESAAGLSPQELRQAFAEDFRDLLADLKL
jgi:hypothetical protein